jgi:hypothetical protein
MAKTNNTNSTHTAGGSKRKRNPKRKKMMKASDPPIIVGGGGSTLIWVRNDITLTQIPLSQISANAPQPNKPAKYQIYECDVDVTTATVRLDQSGGQSKHVGMDKKKHSTEFGV